MADVLGELKDLSEMLQDRRITIPKAHNTMTTFVRRIESLNTHPGKHTISANQAEEAMEFKGEKLSVGRSPIINSGQFIQAVVDNMKERLFTTSANRAQASVSASRRETYNTDKSVCSPRSWQLGPWQSSLRRGGGEGFESGPTSRWKGDPSWFCGVQDLWRQKYPEPDEEAAHGCRHTVSEQCWLWKRI